MEWRIIVLIVININNLVLRKKRSSIILKAFQFPMNCSKTKYEIKLLNVSAYTLCYKNNNPVLFDHFLHLILYTICASLFANKLGFLMNY